MPTVELNSNARLAELCLTMLFSESHKQTALFICQTTTFQDLPVMLED